MILIDATNTCHTLWQSGIQQVCRNLFRELKKRDPDGVDLADPRPLRACWRGPDADESGLMELRTEAVKRFRKGRSWNWGQRTRGRRAKRKNKPFPSPFGVYMRSSARSFSLRP